MHRNADKMFTSQAQLVVTALVLSLLFPCIGCKLIVYAMPVTLIVVSSVLVSPTIYLWDVSEELDFMIESHVAPPWINFCLDQTIDFDRLPNERDRD